MPKLILVRHGETKKNSKGLLHKVFDQERLTNKGKEQIKITAKCLASFKPNLIFSSKEERARESGIILSKELAVPLSEVNGLHERNWGKLSGKPWASVKTILNKMSLEERYNYIPKGGESWKAFEARLVNAIKTLVTNNPNKNLVIVSHGGAIRALMPLLLNKPKEESFKYEPQNASVSIFKILSSGKYINVSINSTSHLSKELQNKLLN